MLKWIGSKIAEVEQIGFDENFSYLENTKTKLINQGVLIVLLLVTINTLESIYFQKLALYVNPVFCLFATVPIFLHKYGRHYLARLYMTFGMSFLVFGFFVVLGYKSGVHFTFFVLALTVIIFYENKLLITCNIIYIVLLLVIGIYYVNTFGAILEKSMINNYVLILNAILTILLISLSVYTMLKAAKYQESLLVKRNEVLEQKNQELHKATKQNDTKDELLKMISHDMRGTSYSFKTLTTQLAYLMKTSNFESLMKLADFYESSGKKLFNDLDNLLYWTLANKDQIAVEKTCFSLFDVVNVVIENLEFAAREKDIKVQNDITRSFLLNSDKNMLSIILRNLIDNAIKYSIRESTIRIDVLTTDLTYELSIVNSGESVNPSFAVAMENSQVSLGKRASNSFGLGIQICLFFTELLAYELTYESGIDNHTVSKLVMPPDFDSATGLLEGE